MESTGYTTLTRQTGLMREMQVIANNIANTATTGFRQEGMVFSEYIARTESAGSVSMAAGRVGTVSFEQGTLTQTGGTFDVAIEGDGFFQIETPQGPRITRAGSFTPNGEGTLVTPDGYPVLDVGGAPIFIPPDAADLSIAADGTLSSQGNPLGQLGLVLPVDPLRLTREAGVMFRADAGVEPVENPRLMHRFLESSNVNPIGQISRMIEVQRAYELGQSFLEREDERVRAALKVFVK